MKYILSIVFLYLYTTAWGQVSTKIPAKYQGKFEDDYGSKYVISDSTFQMVPHSKYHVIEWSEEGQYILAQNDASNKYMPNMYTKISIASLKDMTPYAWAFCFAAYKSATLDEARKGISDAHNPKQGCNGYPFTRMKPSL